MKAIVLREYGNRNGVVYEDLQKPVCPADGILIRVRTSGVNPIDWKIRDGLGKMFGLELPIILGSEIAGTIEDVGSDVRKFKVGQDVLGYLGVYGGHAQYVIAKEDQIVEKPRTLDFESAAAIPLAGLVSTQAMFEAAGLKKGERILIHAAAGGVGSFAVQLAKLQGAYVIATASGKNEAFVRGLGAAEFIDYTKQDFASAVKDVDVVFDTIGGQTQESSFRVLRRGGRLISIVNPPPLSVAESFGVKAEMIAVRPDSSQLLEIVRSVSAGKVKVNVAKVLPFADVQKALELSESGHTRGKIILHVA